MPLDTEQYLLRVERYVNGVLDGDIPACRYVRQAVNRFVRDYERALEEKEIWFDNDAFSYVVWLLEKLPHVKGKWARKRKNFVLSDWQVFITANIFGFKLVKRGVKVNLRRFRDVYVEVPRKNGKTFWFAGIGLYMLAADGEEGAEVYCGATSEKQAHEVYNPARLVCLRKPTFAQHFDITPNKRTLSVLRTGSKFEPVVGNPGDGASPSCGIADEFHEHRTSDLVDTFVTGMGAREQPLMLQITTSGSDMGGPCYEKRMDVIDVLSGVVQDDSIFGIIYTIDEDDQWDTIEAQRKANPNYGISVDEDFLAGQLLQARRSAVKQVAYKTKHLNLWVGAKAAWMNMLAYQACRRDIDLKDYAGKECVLGVDLASKKDLASVAIFFPKERVVFWRHYLPEEIALEVKRYKPWVRGGHIITTPGSRIDFGYIEEDIKEIAKGVTIREIAYDPFQATQFSSNMANAGFEMVEVGAIVKNFSESMKELESWIAERTIVVSKCPVALWMFGNVVAKLDKKDNIFPDKETAAKKIDGVVALLMAVNRTLVPEEEPIPELIVL